MQFRYKYKDVYIFLLIIYYICLPLNAVNIGSFGSALKVISIFPIAISLIGSRKIIFLEPARKQLWFTLFALCSILWSVAYMNSFNRVVSYVLLFSLMISGSAFYYSKAEMKRIQRALVWSSRFTAATMLLFSEYSEGRLWLQSTISEDPNYLCAYLLFGVISALEVLTKEKTTIRKKLIPLVELGIYLYLILASGSRGGFLAVAAASVIFVMTNGDRFVKNLGKKILLLTLGVLLLLVLIDFMPESIQTRFTVANVTESGGTGRTEIWMNAIDLFITSNPIRELIGYGTATVAYCFSEFGYSRVNVVHNIFLESLVELGVIGFILYSSAIYSFAKTAFKFKDKFAFGVIFGMFVMSLSTSLYTFKPYFNIMLFIVILQNTEGYGHSCVQSGKSMANLDV